LEVFVEVSAYFFPFYLHFDDLFHRKLLPGFKSVGDKHYFEYSFQCGNLLSGVLLSGAQILFIE
jgi:hypothetical protein